MPKNDQKSEFQKAITDIQEIREKYDASSSACDLLIRELKELEHKLLTQFFGLSSTEKSKVKPKKKKTALEKEQLATL